MLPVHHMKVKSVQTRNHRCCKSARGEENSLEITLARAVEAAWEYEHRKIKRRQGTNSTNKFKLREEDNM